MKQPISNIDAWDELNGTEKEPLYIPTKEELEQLDVVKTVDLISIEPKTEIVEIKNTEDFTEEFENIAQAMLETRGNLAKASRSDKINFNAMSLRAEVKANPVIRMRYHELLAEELQEKGLHIAERILQMAELQENAMGHTVMVDGPNGPEEVEMPADTKMVIELSKEISRLIAEGKNQNMSAKSSVVLASKEDAIELLSAFLDS